MVLAVLPLCSWAQQNKLIIHPADPLTVKRGAAVSQSLDVAVLPSFHVNSDKPKDAYLIPLKLTWTSGPLVAREIQYPKPEEIKVGGQPALVFTGDFHIATQFLAPANAPAGAAAMVGKLRYQACNSDMCFRPMTVDIRVPVSVQ